MLLNGLQIYEADNKGEMNEIKNLLVVLPVLPQIFNDVKVNLKPYGCFGKMRATFSIWMNRMILSE